MSETITLSSLSKTWLLDLDGTLIKHNGYKIDGEDSFLPGAKEFLLSIPFDDVVIFLTSRTDDYLEQTIDFLNNNNIRFNHIINNLPYGERILINDKKTSGLITAISINHTRDDEFTYPMCINNNI